MPLSTSYDVYSGDKSSLFNSISSTSTTDLKAASIMMNGSTTTWLTPAGVAEIRQEIDNVVKVEWFSYTSITTNADNTVTFNGVSRGLARNGSTFTGTGTGQSFGKGAELRLVDYHYLLNLKANIDRANTFSALQTFSAGLDASGSSSFLRAPRMTTAQRNALTDINGKQVYDTDLGQTFWGEGAAWVSNTSGGSVPDGSVTVAGKFEEATVAQQGTATGAGETGARLVPAVANLVKTSSGAGDENKIAVLDASGQFANGYLGTGTADSTKYLRGDRAWSTIQTYWGSGADGALNVTSGTTSIDCTNLAYVVKNYTSINISAGATVNLTNVPSTGTLLVLLSQTTCTIAGTLDLSSCGGIGGTTQNYVISGTGAAVATGTNGSNGTNNFSQLRGGRGGVGVNGTNDSAASGGAGGGNAATAGTASSDAVADTATGTGAVGGVALTAAIYSIAQSSRGIIVGPGGGGGAGGYAVDVDGYTSGTRTITTGAGGRGGGGLYIACGTDFSFTGTINLSGAAGTAAVAAAGAPDASITNFSYAFSGGGGGASGVGLAVVGGLITNSGTATVTGGAGSSTGVTLTNGGYSATVSNGANGAAGIFYVMQGA